MRMGAYGGLKSNVRTLFMQEIGNRPGKVTSAPAADADNRLYSADRV